MTILALQGILIGVRSKKGSSLHTELRKRFSFATRGALLEVFRARLTSDVRR